MEKHERYMRRCFELARLGRGGASPNPLVGALLEYEGRILSEGFHAAFGKAHAEVRAIEALSPADAHLVSKATMYVSLEPCCFFGKTPPCTQLLITRKVPRVVISCLDESPEVSGRGVAQLRAAGAEVITGVLEEEGRRLSRPRKIFVTRGRPYVILKFAQSRNGMFGSPLGEQVWITNAYARRLVHRWRAEVDAILVGTRTALIDDPELTTRYYPGRSPLRVVLDRQGKLPAHLKLFDGKHPTLRITAHGAPITELPQVETQAMVFDEALLPGLLRSLHDRQIGLLMVEGGSQLLKSFIQAGLWDEARVLTGAGFLQAGLPAPVLEGPPSETYALGDNEVAFYYRS